MASPMNDPARASQPTGEEEDLSYRLHALKVCGQWSVQDDGDGHLFYYDHATKQSQWGAPRELAAQEGDFMMELMLVQALAKSGGWSAHDAGNGTLYYFNRKTRESVWERPAEWGMPEEPESLPEPMDIPPPPPEPPVEEKASEPTSEEEEEEEVELTEEEIQQAKEKEEKAAKLRHEFQELLREKKIMPFTKWSVALPKIINDMRFQAIPTMDERRAVFEDFVAHRREELKGEKKQRLDSAKKDFAKLLQQYLRPSLLSCIVNDTKPLSKWVNGQRLSVILATMHQDKGEEEYKQIQTNVLDYLPMKSQDKVVSKVVKELEEEGKSVQEQIKYVEKELEKLVSKEGRQNVSFETPRVQKLLHQVVPRGENNDQILSFEQQRQLFRRVVPPGGKTEHNHAQERSYYGPSHSSSRRRSPSPRHRRRSHRSRSRSRSQSRR